MSWQFTSLDKVVTFQRGFDLPKSKFKNGFFPVVGSKNIIGYHSEFKVMPPGIVTGRSGTLGNFQYLTEKFWPHNTTLWVKDFKGNHPKYVYYLLKTLNFSFLNGGASVPTLNRNVLKSINLKYTSSIQVQARIATILSTYDDLIENNLKRITLLEEAAQNIYEEWFVNMRFPGSDSGPFHSKAELPPEWHIKTLEDVLEKVKRKGKLQKADYEENGKYPVIDQGDGFIGGFSSTSSLVQNESLPIVIFGDHTRRVKYVNFPFISGADGTQLLRPKNKDLLPAYFYLTVKSIDLSDYAYARHFKYLKQQEIILPDKDVLKLFNVIVSPMLEKVIMLDRYNRKLTECRNVLLPRLLNQTIKV